MTLTAVGTVDLSSLLSWAQAFANCTTPNTNARNYIILLSQGEVRFLPKTTNMGLLETNLNLSRKVFPIPFRCGRGGNNYNLLVDSYSAYSRI